MGTKLDRIFSDGALGGVMFRPKKNGLIRSMLQKSQGCTKTPGGIWMCKDWNYLEILLMVQKFQNNHLGWW